jgi:HD-GYP domain-containing protein (c-di-GMP phosphodiesterase class II)
MYSRRASRHSWDDRGDIRLTDTSSAQRRREFVAVDLRGFSAERPPLVDLYHLVGDQFVLYCEARSVFSEAARLRLVSTGVVTLYIRITRGGIDAGGTDIPTLLSLPDTHLAPSVKSAILYKSASDTSQSIYESPLRPGNLDAAQRMVGLVAMRIVSNADAFASVVELMEHNSFLYCHAVNVCTYAIALGDRMNLMKPVLITLGTSALVHDVGMTRVPRRIIDKPGSLTADEFAIVKRHPDWGFELLGAHQGQRALISSIVRDHHERVDGTGYPRNLRGSQVDLLTRIVTIANMYDALTGNRAYRQAYSPFVALDTMKRETGIFDPDIFTQFVQLLGSTHL